MWNRYDNYLPGLSARGIAEGVQFSETIRNVLIADLDMNMVPKILTDYQDQRVLDISSDFAVRQDHTVIIRFSVHKRLNLLKSKQGCLEL